MSVIGVVTTARFWKIFGGAIFGLLLLSVGASFAFVHQAGGLPQLVEQRLNKISDRLVVAVADAEVRHKHKLKQLQVVVVAEHVVARNKRSLIRNK